MPQLTVLSFAVALAGLILKFKGSPLLVPVEDPEEQRARLAMLGLTGRYNERPHATGALASWKAAQHKSAHGPSPRTRMQMGKGPFGWLENNKDVEGRDKMWEEQQKILQARRKGTSMDQVKVRRDRVAKYNRGQLPKEEMDAIKKKNEAKAKALSKEAMKGGLPLPMASFGMPEFDGGERFDLKGPYVDEGWVDENDEGPFGWLPWNKKKDQEDK
jgi:hypothetical protein